MKWGRFESQEGPEQGSIPEQGRIRPVRGPGSAHCLPQGVGGEWTCARARVRRALSRTESDLNKLTCNAGLSSTPRFKSLRSTNGRSRALQKETLANIQLRDLSRRGRKHFFLNH